MLKNFYSNKKMKKWAIAVSSWCFLYYIDTVSGIGLLVDLLTISSISTRFNTLNKKKKKKKKKKNLRKTFWKKAKLLKISN